jgi:hypothetical protein
MSKSCSHVSSLPFASTCHTLNYIVPATSKARNPCCSFLSEKEKGSIPCAVSTRNTGYCTGSISHRMQRLIRPGVLAKCPLGAKWVGTKCTTWSHSGKPQRGFVPQSRLISDKSFHSLSPRGTLPLLSQDLSVQSNPKPRAPRVATSHFPTRIPPPPVQRWYANK